MLLISQSEHLLRRIKCWQERKANRGASFKSIDIEIVPGCNIALIELANFFQHLLFAARFTALLCARLVATRVGAMVEDQQAWLCSVCNLRQLFRGRVVVQTILLPL